MVQALATARLFVAVVAVPVPPPTWLCSRPRCRVPARAARLRRPEALARFRADARPVPVAAPRAALSAVAEGCDLLDLDPAGPWATSSGAPPCGPRAGRRWVPSCAEPGWPRRMRLGAEVGGRATAARGAASELRVELALPPGLDAAGLQAGLPRRAGGEPERSGGRAGRRTGGGADVLPVVRTRGSGPPPRWSLAIGTGLRHDGPVPLSDTAKSCARPACSGCCSSASSRAGRSSRSARASASTSS